MNATKLGKTVSVFVAALTVGAALSSCSILFGTGTPGESQDFYDQQYEQAQEEAQIPEFEPPSDSEIEQGIREVEKRVAEKFGLGTWTCRYDPTMNDDWHDDVLCTDLDGAGYDRPYLLPNDSFVTHAEMMEAAAKYEEQLNSQP